jgi:hypothetical protein
MRRSIPPLLVALLAACGPSGQAASPSLPPAPAASAVAPPPAPTTSTTAPEAPKPPAPERCGELDCQLFDTPEAAFAAILAENPVVLGIGESHAQKSAGGVPSSTRHFTEQFLPMLAGKASDVVLEIWVSEGKCGKEKEKQVAEQQKPVTQNQAQNNQNEFVTLGDAAYKLGVKPHILKASCADYDAIVKAGDDSVIVMLEMITRLMDEKVKALVARNASAGAERMVLTYAGALHNDLVPRPGREKWSFGPDLSAFTQGRYAEVDLIVPEFIQDSDAWKALPWYPHYDRNAHPTKTTLFRPAKGSFVLIFPRS